MSPTSNADATRPVRRKWHQWLFLLGALLVSAAAIASAYLLFQANRAANSLGRFELSEALVEPAGPDEAVNVLLMAFDSESVLAPDDPLRQASLDAQRQARMVWVLRIDPTDESLTLLSIDPQTEVQAQANAAEPAVDPEAGTDAAGLGVAVGRVASVAGVDGAVTAVATTLGIDLHHYVEMDLREVASLVDAVGGVPVYLPNPVRDLASGFVATQQGCVVLDGETTRSYLEAASLEVEIDGAFTDSATVAGWTPIERERDVLAALLREVPSGWTEIISRYRFWEAAADAVSVDLGLSRGGFIDRVENAADYQERQFYAFTLPVAGPTGPEPVASVPIIEGTETAGILSVFRGERGSRLDQVRDQAVRPGMTGLRSITCRT